MSLSPEEKKRRKAERQRIYRAAFTPEQKGRKQDHFRKWYAKRTPEQIEITREKDRLRDSRPERKDRRGKNYSTPEAKERRRENSLKSSYKITSQDWERLFNEQGRCCAICKSKDPEGRWRFWHTDHCHKSGKVRGILCHSRNVGLGNFKDNSAFLLAAAAYLTKSKGELNDATTLVSPAVWCGVLVPLCDVANHEQQLSSR